MCNSASQPPGKEIIQNNVTNEERSREHSTGKSIIFKHKVRKTQSEIRTKEPLEHSTENIF